ncbi:MAG TPA: hypothetical protein VGL93_05545 [Streptosporangiaceae bacterium]|jgi:hypothetical protein
MRHARLAALSVLAAGVMVLAAGCGGSGGASSGASSQASSQPTHTEPKVSTFAQFPGKELKHFRELPTKPGVRVKGIDSMWAPELLGKSAEAGRHFLAVYVAVTPEANDRGSQEVSLKGLTVRLNTPCQQSDGETDTGNGGEKVCPYDAYPYSQLESGIPDGRWRTADFTYSEIRTDDVAAGETRIGVVGYNVSDEAHGTFTLCAPGLPVDLHDNYSDIRPPSCVPIPQPKNAR